MAAFFIIKVIISASILLRNNMVGVKIRRFRIKESIYVGSE